MAQAALRFAVFLAYLLIGTISVAYGSEGFNPSTQAILHGSLPYRNLNYPSREPDNSALIKAAYQGGDKSVSPEDTADTPYAPSSVEIAELAQTLKWNPVLIYEYVKNNIETEWYWGCMKGAEETLRQKSGNDCDQATLLVALLRVSGYPARYVRGTMEFFAGGRNGVPMDRIRNLTGIGDPLKIAEMFQTAGIPYRPVIQGGSIVNFELEHIWVESYIPYGNYRGAVMDGSDPLWLGLDTSIKVKGYEYSGPVELSAFSDQLSAMRDEYLNREHALTPLEYFRERLTALTGQPADLFKLTRTLRSEVLNILPSSLQFVQKRVTHEYTEIPEVLRHKVRLTALSNQPSANSNPLFDLTIDLMKLNNRQVILTYEPETVEDQEVMDSYGGLDNTPAYLMRLRPTLKVDGERVAVGRDGLPMGTGYDLAIELISPNGTERVVNAQIAGSLAAIGITGQRVVSGQPLAISDQQSADSLKLTAEDLYSREAYRYIEIWNRSEEELASLLQLRVTRPIPTVVTVGGVIDVTYLEGMPYGFEWKGLYMDAGLRAVSVQPSAVRQDIDTRKKAFMSLSALEGSVLEHRIFEEDFGVDSISTAKMVQVSSQQSAVSYQLKTIDKTNIDTVLPMLSLEENIREDIINSVNQGYEVRIPVADDRQQSAISYKDWTGIGYIKEDPATGEAGYMLSGMIAGGMTAQSPEKWVNQYIAKILRRTYTRTPSKGPAAKIIKIPVTDKQPPGVVGQTLLRPLAVLVLDSKNRPVEGANVTFKTIAADGKVTCMNSWDKEVGSPSSECTIQSGPNGIAKAKLTLGTETFGNPIYRKINQKDKYFTQMGFNLIIASVATPIGNLSVPQPFEAYAKPDVPHHIVKGLGDGNNTIVNNPAGSLTAKLVDKYENPISNAVLTFTAVSAESNDTNPLPSDYRNIEFYKKENCSNPYPLYGECATEPSVEQTTQYFGGTIWTMLGNTVNTKYTVIVTAPVLPPDKAEAFYLYSWGYRGNADAYVAPWLYMGYIAAVNDKGEPVNASKAGTQLKAPLVAGLYLTQDNFTTEGPYSCNINKQPMNCWKIRPTGILKTTRVNDGSVAFTPLQGGGTLTPTEHLKNGSYQTWFTTGSVPAVNVINAEATATINVNEIFYDPDAKSYASLSQIPAFRPVALKAGQMPFFDKDTQKAIIPVTIPPYQKLEYTVYGVLPEITGTDPALISLQEDGHPTHEIKVKYSINPVEYSASYVDVRIWERDPLNAYPDADILQYYVPGISTKGYGDATIFRDITFKFNRKYYAQNMLNEGSDAAVRSEKLELVFESVCFLSYGYDNAAYRYDPNQYDEVIKCAAIEEGVNPLTIKEIIAAESSFNQNEYTSGDSATGLMQIIPARAREAGITGTDIEIIEKLKNPCTNIEAGAKIIGSSIRDIESILLAGGIPYRDEDMRVYLELYYNGGKGTFLKALQIAQNYDIKVESWRDFTIAQDVLGGISIIRKVVRETLSTAAKQSTPRQLNKKDMVLS